MKIVPVLLAGGVGERFWPLSRSGVPKQLLSIVSEKTMIEETLFRVSYFCKDDVRPIIVTGRSIVSKIQSALRGKVGCDYIVEPEGKNTAPAIAAAAAYILKMHGDAVMLVLPADHSISPKNEFVKAVRYASSLACRQDTLTVFGIKPDRPETGYGYILTGKNIGSKGGVFSYRVSRFVEKPSSKRAKMFSRSGNYLWNSGMFVWKASVIMEEMRKYMPDMYRDASLLTTGIFSSKNVDKFYRKCLKESIDYGIMEKSRRTVVVKGLFRWDDIGSWESVRRLKPLTDSGTAISGSGIFLDECLESVVVNRSKLTVAVFGISHTVVVVTDDAIMVIPRSRLPQLKQYLGNMKKNKNIPKNLF